MLGLFNAAILVAIVAVILSSGSKSADIIKSFFAFLAWLVSQVIKPVPTGGTAVALGTTLAPAGAGDAGTTDAALAGTTGGPGTTSALTASTLATPWSSAEIANNGPLSEGGAVGNDGVIDVTGYAR